MFGLDTLSNLFKAIEGWCNMHSTSIANQSTTNVLSDKKKNEKALVYAEQAIEIAETTGVFRSKDKKRFMYFVKKFRKEIARS